MVFLSILPPHPPPWPAGVGGLRSWMLQVRCVHPSQFATPFHHRMGRYRARSPMPQELPRLAATGGPGLAVFCRPNSNKGPFLWRPVPSWKSVSVSMVPRLALVGRAALNYTDNPSSCQNRNPRSGTGLEILTLVRGFMGLT